MTLPLVTSIFNAPERALDLCSTRWGRIVPANKRILGLGRWKNNAYGSKYAGYRTKMGMLLLRRARGEFNFAATRSLSSKIVRGRWGARFSSLAPDTGLAS